MNEPFNCPDCRASLTSAKEVISLQLIHVEEVGDGNVWLCYEVNK
jgi:riboflavin biosynthesis pyrimidine reductase